VNIHSFSLTFVDHTVAQSDGHLLTIEDIDITEILQSGKELYNKPEDLVDVQDIYSGNWVGKQRAALRRRLGKESGNDVDATATRFISLKGMIKSSDVSVKAPIVTSSTPLATDSNSLLGADSSETWLVRMFRFLIAGLVHSRWEYRHGHCLGLIALFEGLNLLDTDSQQTLSSHLPLFLFEDIVTTAITVLLLDRYLDVDGSQNTNLQYFIHSNASLSDECPRDLFAYPVKEAAARLLGVVCSRMGCLDQQFATQCTSKILSFCFLNAETSSPSSSLQSVSHWSVILSGYITMKHLLRITPCVAMMMEAGQGIPLFQSIRQGLQATNEEIRHEALSCLGSLKTVQTQSLSPQVVEFLCSSLESAFQDSQHLIEETSDSLLTTLPLLMEIYELYFIFPRLQSSAAFSRLFQNFDRMLGQYSKLFQRSTAADQTQSLERSCRHVIQKVIVFTQTLIDCDAIAPVSSVNELTSLLQSALQLLIRLLTTPLHFSTNFSLTGLHSLVKKVTLQFEIRPLVSNFIPSEHRPRATISLQPINEFVNQLISQIRVAEGLETESRFEPEIVLIMAGLILEQEISPLPPQPFPAPAVSTSTRSLRKRKRVPNSSFVSTEQLQFASSSHHTIGINFKLVPRVTLFRDSPVPLLRLDIGYPPENGMFFATTLAGILSLSSALCLQDKELLLHSFLGHLEGILESVMGAAFEIDNSQRGSLDASLSAPIFVIVNEAGSVLGNCSPQSQKEIDRLIFLCQKLLWMSWLTISVTHQLRLQHDTCGLSVPDLDPLIRFFSEAIETLSPVNSLHDSQPQLVSEIKLCHRILLLSSQTLQPTTPCEATVLQTFSRSLPTSAGHYYFSSHLVSGLFLHLGEQSLSVAMRFLLAHFRSLPPSPSPRLTLLLKWAHLRE
jgi:hypothetical protein